MPGYFYTHVGGQCGPVSGQQLKQLASQGQLVPEDFVWSEGGDRRFLARDVKGLFVMATPPSVATESRIPEAEVISYDSCVSCPFCQNRIINDGSRAGQTVNCPHCGESVQMPGGGTQVIPPPITASPIVPTSVAANMARQPSDPYDFLDGLDDRPSFQTRTPRLRSTRLKGLAVTLATATGSLLVLVLLCIYWSPMSNTSAKTPSDTIATNNVPIATEQKPSRSNASSNLQHPNIQSKHVRRSLRAGEARQDRRYKQSFWSNDPIPLLYGMPNSVRSQMPEMQKRIVDEIGVLLKEVRAKGAVTNSFARDEIDKTIQKDSEEFFERYWTELCKTRRIEGWVGCIRFPASYEITVGFGNTYNWVTCGDAFPEANDKECAYRTCMNNLYHITFESRMFSSSAKEKLKTLKDGDWVKVTAELMKQPDDRGSLVSPMPFWPTAHLDEWNHFTVSDANGRDWNLKLTDIQRIDAPAVDPAAANATPEEPIPSAVAGAPMMKDEWKARAWKIRSKTGKASQDEIRRIFGEPFRTQTIADKQFWYWRCRDGIIQAEVVAYGDEVYIIGVNDY